MVKRRLARPQRQTDLGVRPDHIERSILVIRGEKVLLDTTLAAFYAVSTSALVQAVQRNRDRFPADFIFRLTANEWAALRSQTVISKPSSRGGRRFSPYAFTEQGVAMLSSVLRSTRAVQINIQIMRAFVRLRQLLSVHKELADRLTKLERQMRRRDRSTDQQFQQVFTLLDQLFSPPDPPRRPIGFHGEREPAEGKP